MLQCVTWWTEPHNQQSATPCVPEIVVCLQPSKRFGPARQAMVWFCEQTDLDRVIYQLLGCMLDHSKRFFTTFTSPLCGTTARTRTHFFPPSSLATSFTTISQTIQIFRSWMSLLCFGAYLTTVRAAIVRTLVSMKRFDWFDLLADTAPFLSDWYSKMPWRLRRSHAASATPSFSGALHNLPTICRLRVSPVRDFAKRTASLACFVQLSARFTLMRVSKPIIFIAAELTQWLHNVTGGTATNITRLVFARLLPVCQPPLLTGGNRASFTNGVVAASFTTAAMEVGDWLCDATLGALVNFASIFWSHPFRLAAPSSPLLRIRQYARFAPIDAPERPIRVAMKFCEWLNDVTLGAAPLSGVARQAAHGSIL